MTTKIDLIKEILSDMTYDESIRNGIYKCKSNKFQDFFFHCHGDGDLLPDDHRYEMIHNLLASMSEYEEIKNDIMYDILNDNIPVYYHELLSWVSSNLSRSDYVDEAIEEYEDMKFDFFNLLSLGYYKELEEVYALMNEWIDENSEGNEDA